MGHRAQERADRPKEPEGSHPPPQHRLYPDAARSERYKEPAQRVSRRTRSADPIPRPRIAGARLHMTDYQIFEAGDVVLQSGLTYRNARLAYKTHGTLDAAKSNVIVYPTSYGAQHPDLEWLIAPGRALDPTRYFIVIINKFGNGLSSSPSTTPR